MKTITKFFKYTKSGKVKLFVIVILSILSVLLTLYMPILVAKAIDLMKGFNNVQFKEIGILLYEFIGITLIIAFLEWYMNNLSNTIVLDIEKNLRNEAFTKIENVPLKFIDTTMHGDIINSIISDVDQVSNGLLLGLRQFLTGIITIILTIIFMIKLNYIIAITIIVLTPISVLVSKFISKKSYNLFKSQIETKAQQSSLVNETIKNQKTVIAFSAEDKMINNFKFINKDLEKKSIKATFYSSITNPCTRFINNIVYAIVIYIGAKLIINKTITVGLLTCFITYTNQYFKPFNEISGIITEIQNAIASFDRIQKIISKKSESKDYRKTNLNVIGDVSFENVKFSYNKKKTNIDDFNLKVKAGTKVAIVGPTGAGKTTIINLLMRFYDADQGQILIDGENIKSYIRKDLRKSFGMVLQDTWIKNASLRDNFKLAKKDASDDEIINAAKKSMCFDLIKKMPNGLDTIVSDNDLLSEGEKQLISITRIILLNPPILILDEATSNIDTRTEIKIQKAFDELMKNKTSFVVAHRLSTIVSADIIVVIKDGKIIEKGKHNELISQNGYYSELYNSQFINS